MTDVKTNQQRLNAQQQAEDSQIYKRAFVNRYLIIYFFCPCWVGVYPQVKTFYLNVNAKCNTVITLHVLKIACI